MASNENINPPIGLFPKQSEYLHRRVEVCFHYDTSRIVMGTIVRDDYEEPHLLLIALDDGHVVRSTECQYSFVALALETNPLG